MPLDNQLKSVSSGIADADNGSLFHDRRLA